MRDALAAAAQQVAQEPLLDVENVAGPLRQIGTLQTLEHLGVAAERAADGVLGRVVPLLGSSPEVRLRRRVVLQHLQVGLEDRAVLLAQLLRRRPRRLWAISPAAAAMALSSRSNSSSTASRETNRRGMRKPSLSITSASPMATPGETAIP